MKPQTDADPSDIVSPRQARRRFLKDKRGTVKESTARAYKFPTKHFVEFCEEHELETMGEVGGHILEGWKRRRKDEPVKMITVHNNAKHLRVFIRWAERNELVQAGLADRMDIPDVPNNGEVSEESLGAEQAQSMLEYLGTYEYGTRKHALFHTMWHIGCRISGAMALDQSDFQVFSDGEAILQLRNRPELGTPLKNKDKSERNVTINEDLKHTLKDYIEGRREDTLDDFDREPLFTTTHGRVSRQRAYKDYTALSRPCVYGPCPHDRDPETCEHAVSKNQAPGCPSSVSLHPVRRGSITNHLNIGWPKEKLSERVDVSVSVLEKHYDARTHEKKREGRKEFVDLM